MSGTHVRVRFSWVGMVAGDFLARHPGGRLAVVEVGRRETRLGLVIDLAVLAAGMPDAALAEFARAWHGRYGLQPVSLGAPFALRLSVPVARTTSPVAAVLPSDLAPGTPLGHMLHAGHCDLWVSCHDGMAAEQLAGRLRKRLSPADATVVAGDPPVSDLECWAALRLASDTTPLAT